MKTLYKQLLVLIFSWVLVSCEQDLTAVESVAKAKDFIDVGDYSSANVELMNAAAKDPTNIEIRFELAKVSYQLGDFSAAERNIKIARDLGLSPAAAQPFLMLILAATNNREQAILEGSSLAEGLSEESQSLVYGVLAQAFMGEKNYEKAEHVIKRALDKTTVSEEAFIAKAGWAIFYEDTAGARSWLKKGLDQNQNSPKLWSAWGDVESMAGNPSAAIDAYSKAIELFRYTSLDRGKRALILIEQGDLDSAEKDVTALRQSGYKDYWYASYIEGRLQFARKQYREALDSFLTVLKQVETDIPSLTYSALAHTQLGNIQQALSFADKLAFLLPTSNEVKGLKGNILIRKKDFKGALKLLEELQQIDGQNAELLRLQGLVHFGDGNGTKAKYFFEKFLELKPDSQEAVRYIMLSSLLLSEDLNTPGSAALQATMDSYTRELLQTASHFQQGRLKEAREQALKLINAYPGAVEPRNLLAASYLAVSDWDRARDELKKVLDISATDESALMNLARLELINLDKAAARDYTQRLLDAHQEKSATTLFVSDMWLKLGETENAEQLLSQAVKNNPEDPALRSALMLRFYQTQQYGQVIELGRGQIDDLPDGHPQIPDLLALAYRKNGDIELALQTAEKWVRQDPGLALAQFRYAGLLRESGTESKKAKSAYEKAAQLAPNDATVAIERVRYLGQVGDLSGARSALDDALKARPDIPVLASLDGWLALLNKNYAVAADKLSNAQKLQPSSENIILLARALAYQSKTDDALAVLNQWLTDSPDDLNVLLHKAGIFLAKNDEGNALTVYKTILEHHPDHVASLNNAAWLSRETDQDKALDYAMKAKQLAPRDPYVLDTLGHLVFLKGDVRKGANILAEALALAPNDQRIKLHLASALLRSDESSKARQMLVDMLAGDADKALKQEAQGLLDSI